MKQKTIANGLSEIAIYSADTKRLSDIGATGGVFYNEAITDACKNYIESNIKSLNKHKRK